MSEESSQSSEVNSKSTVFDLITSEGVALAVFTGMTYAGAYSFELGKALFLGVPREIVSVSTDNILSFFFVSFLLYTSIVYYASTFFSIFYLVDSAKTYIDNEGILVLIGNFIVWLAMVMAFYMVGLFFVSPNWVVAAVNMLLILLFLNSDIIIQTKLQSKSLSLKEKLKNYRLADRVKPTYPILDKLGVGSKRALFVTVIYVVCSFAYGYNYPAMPKTYSAMKMDSEFILVAKYGDLFVFRKVSPDKHMLLRETIVKKIDGDTVLDFTTVYIDSLQAYRSN